MLVKVHNSYRDVVAVCDSKLLGERFEEGKRLLHIKEGFFGGGEMEEKELIQMMKDYDKEDATFNIVGEKSVQAAKKAGIVNVQGVKKVQDVPFALVLL